jgi:phage-related protein
MDISALRNNDWSHTTENKRNTEQKENNCKRELKVPCKKKRNYIENAKKIWNKRYEQNTMDTLINRARME